MDSHIEGQSLKTAYCKGCLRVQTHKLLRGKWICPDEDRHSTIQKGFTNDGPFSKLNPADYPNVPRNNH